MSSSIDSTNQDTCLPGIDVKTGLTNIANHVSGYKRILASFQQHHSDDPEKLQTLYQRAEWFELGNLAHSLMGAAANIGATALSRHAYTLEKASDQSDAEAIKASLEEVQAALEQVMSGLDELNEFDFESL